MKPQVTAEPPVAGSLPSSPGIPGLGRRWGGLRDTSLHLLGRQPGPAVVTSVKHLQNSHQHRVSEGTTPSPQVLKALLGLAQSCPGSEALGSQQRLSMPLAILSTAHSPHISAFKGKQLTISVEATGSSLLVPYF